MNVIISLFFVLFGLILGITLSNNHNKFKMENALRLADKHLEMFLLMNQWVQNEHKGKKIKKYLEDKGIHNVIVYGMGYIGKNLYEQLKNEKFEIKCVVDKNKNLTFESEEVKGINSEIDKADAVIVTAIYYYDELEEQLRERFNTRIISLADIIYKM